MAKHALFRVLAFSTIVAKFATVATSLRATVVTEEPVSVATGARSLFDVARASVEAVVVWTTVRN